ncbi:OLC1v1015922C1 [Oldenlandia corymbosa var. corymbosa]|uniref:OLC1v1015922C1 n=1 Tax=Oldenlandia corymbosa var. corymbosa TaxID=529605 RepID=A0AAV1E497_OLDCO|nr:OLC1v1015922C1 [Oldenlandia corymbosa var. corymbosa]
MLSLLIPGPKAPGKNIDTYLQPLIADLKELWEDGVETYDASSKQNFKLHASVLWTISDFPGYANLSGWSTKGKFACPTCHKGTHSFWLSKGNKFCYMGHRRFLGKEHRFRKNAQLFDGSIENGTPPQQLSGDMVIDELKDFSIRLGIGVQGNPELPFSKSKDNYNSRRDLKEMGIRPEFHLVEKESGKVYIPPALYKLNRDEKNTFCDILRNVKVPDGYSSNISRCVQLTPPKLIGLKSHDYHILMQQLLPIALRKMLSTSIRSPLLRLCAYFRELCSKEIFPEDVARLENEIPVILCELEKIFPPSFFDIMVHLPVHLATEVKLAGPVYYRLMYPIERYLGTLKSHVRNRSILEGSIAKGYLAEECLTFCSLYLAEYVETKFNRTSRNEDRNTDDVAGLDIFNMGGHPLGKATPTEFDDETLKKGHQYVEGLEVIEGDPISRDLKFLGNSNWHVVVSTVARARYKMESLADVETFLQSNVCNPTGSFESDDFILVREEEEEGTEIDIDRLKEKSKKSKKHKSRSHS